jgi:hypothetical protein
VGSAAVAFAAGNVARSVINQYTQFERYRTVLTTFLGSQQAANQELQRLQVLANSLPQDLADITNAFTILSRFGIDTSSESLTAFSNIATANAKSFTQLGEAVADALTGEFERLKEFGIKVSRENDQFVARIGSQQVAVSDTTQDLVRQLQRLGEEGGRFGGAAAANATTLNQSFSNLQGALFQTAVTIGEELSPALSDLVNDTSKLLINNQQLAASFGAGLGEAIRGAAGAIKFLADNFELIKNAALFLIFTRIASSIATFIGSIARATAAAKTFGGIASGVGKTFAAVGGSIAKLVGRVTGLGAALRFVAGLTPIGRVISIGITAAIAALTFLRNRTFQIGETTTTVSEIARAVFFKIGQFATAAANVIGQAWQNVVTQVSRFFTEGFGANILEVLRSVGAFALDVANAFIGYFVVSYRAIVGIFRNLPTAFVEVFRAIGATASDFGSRIVSQFGGIGEALLIAIRAPFTDDTFEDALNAITTNAFAGFGEAISENFAPIGEGISAALESAGDALSENYIENALGAIGGAVEQTVLEFREFEAASAAAAAAIEPYDDAVQRAARGLGVLSTEQAQAAETISPLQQRFNEVVTAAREASESQELNRQVLGLLTQAYRDGTISLEVYNQALAQIGETATATGSQLSAYQQFLNQTIQSATQSAQQIGFASQAQADLKAQLDSGQISIDTYAQAMQNLNGILGVTTETTTSSTAATREQLSVYEKAVKTIADTNAKTKETGIAMSQLQKDFNNGKFSLEEFRMGMESMGLSTDDLSDRSIAMGLTMTDAFTSAGDSLARGLARGIARGESIMGSFKGFMQSILDEILYQIIQQAFIKPMISSLTAGFGSAFSAFGAGGAGAFGGGGFGTMIGGSLFGPIGGLLGGFLGFAQGGVVPGRPTAGDSVPVLATPGEVILNKQQQAQVLQGGGEEPITVNFNISAIDSRSGTEFIMQNKKQITGVIQQAYNTRGQSGPLG